MGMVFCRGCGKEIHESAPTCPQCGSPQSIKNTTTDTIPDGIKGWSWGSFFLNWIWAIGNKTWIGLLTLIPFVWFIMPIILGFKGREWAWKNKHWDSVEHFNRVQRKWSVWGVVFACSVSVIGILAGVAIPAYSDYQHNVLAAKDVQGQASPYRKDMTLDEALKVQQGTGQQLVGTTAATTPRSTLPKLSAAAEKAVNEGFVEITNPTVQVCTDARIAAIKKEIGADTPINYEMYNEAAVKCGFNI